MAGTRLAAHTCFLIFSLISVLVAWRLGVVKRTPLPLKNLAQLSAFEASAAERGFPVDIDVVLLRRPNDGDCPSCAAVLDAMQANPSLARNAFREAEQAADPAADNNKRRDHLKETDGATAEESRSEAEQQGASGIIPRLIAVRGVNLRVMHTDDGVAATKSAAPSVSSEPAALDDWLHRYFIPSPQRRRQQQPNATEEDHPPTATFAANPSSARYTFFVGCAGAGAAGELPTFVMGRRRHGYLGLGCACSSSPCGNDAEDAETTGGRTVSVGAEGAHVSGLAAGAAGAEGVATAAAAAALAALRALAGIVVAHVLLSPVKTSDVHVRLGQAYRLSFSLLSEDPARRRCAWDFAGASRRYLRPMLRKLHPVANFAVQSQEVQYARLSAAPPRMFSAKKRWYYSPGDLKGFLGANDFSTLDLAAGWGLDDEVGISPGSAVSPPHSQVPVNFMVFCPSPKRSPLVFMEEWAGAGGQNRPSAEAYEVPGFGGVSVVNADGGGAEVDRGAVDTLGPDRLRRALGAHVSQLRRIIGLPRPSDRPSEVPWPWLPAPEADEGKSGRGSSSSSSDNGAAASLCGSCSVSDASRRSHRSLPLTFLPSPTDGVTDWEVDALMRAGMARNRAAATETLRSLAALVESQPEMEVSPKIAADVAAAIAALAKADATHAEAISGAESMGSASLWGTERRGAAAPPTGVGKVGLQENVGEDEEEEGGGSAAGRGSGVEWEYARAMRWAREALRRSEAAYFDPTMVPQLYFPQDHLMAVYLPFLGPLAFPLLWGFVQELWRYLKKRKAKRDRTSEGDRKTGDLDSDRG